MSASLVAILVYNSVKAQMEATYAHARLVTLLEKTMKLVVVSFSIMFTLDTYLYIVSTGINDCFISYNPCSQLCQNNNGSYTCSCQPGYVPITNNQTCSGGLLR